PPGRREREKLHQAEGVAATERLWRHPVTVDPQFEVTKQRHLDPTPRGRLLKWAVRRWFAVSRHRPTPARISRHVRRHPDVRLPATAHRNSPDNVITNVAPFG